MKANGYFADRMSRFPAGIRQALRDDFTLGPVPWGMWSFTLQDGSTWAAIACSGFALDADTIMGWAGLSMETDLRPVVGVYVAEQHRRKGIGESLVLKLLHDLRSAHVLAPGDTIFASAHRWPRYFDLIDSCDLVCEQWQ